jgi:hypothetical protein
MLKTSLLKFNFMSKVKMKLKCSYFKLDVSEFIL